MRTHSPLVELQTKRLPLQESMNFLGAIASGIEEAVGQPANSITHLAGEKLGMRMSENARKTDNLEKALAELGRILKENHCLWLFEPFQVKERKHMIQKTAEGVEIMLVFRDCMIRQSLFRFGHQQKGSLCNLMFGFFSGALRNIMGVDSKLEIVHAGENACYKRLTILKGDANESRG